MPQAILRMNEERTAFQVQVDEQEFETAAWPQSQLQLMQDPSGVVYAAVLDGCESLKPYTVYRLEALPTMTVNEEFEEDDDDEFDPADAEEEDDDDEDDDDEDDKE